MGNETRALSRPFNLRQCVIRITIAALGIGLVVPSYEILAVFGVCVAVAGGFASSSADRRALREGAITGALCVFSVLTVLALRLVSQKLNLVSKPSTLEVWLARFVWVISILMFSIVPVAVGAMFYRMSGFAWTVITVLVVASGIAFVRFMEPAETALLLWTASVVNLVGASECCYCVRRRKWIVLPVVVSCIMVGLLLVIALTWACLFLE